MISRIYLGMPQTPAEPGAIQALERKLVTVAGGFTAFAGSGMWLNPQTGQLEEELAYVYEVVHSSGPEVMAGLREFALAMKVLLVQKEVLLVHIPAEKRVL